ncbi:MAG: hypothetical protein CMP66_03800 [Flavobacteriales bacterium]|nr:hypothetical protein [Flavobacteriales bacterium]|tara:strand:+ start:10452 stop:11093 length:642 start_codon:yes stop_codon:yes gene_type:complete
MRSFLLTFIIALGLFQSINAQGVVTAVPCDMLGMVINVGSQETSISIYHSGQYMTHPQSENIFMWEFTDQQGNVLHQDTLVDASTISFGHNWSLTDTINVTVHFINDSANLNNWYISEGLEPNGNSINCLFEDQIFWHIDTFPTGTPYGTWTFINNNPGEDLNTPTAINNFVLEKKRLINVVDIIGRQSKGLKNQPLFYIYDDGSVEKRIILE